MVLGLAAYGVFHLLLLFLMFGKQPSFLVTLLTCFQRSKQHPSNSAELLVAEAHLDSFV